jgi:hypothetical protein
MSEEELIERRKELYNQKLCDERHKYIQEALGSLNAKMTGFYVLAIATLAAVVGNFFKNG